MYFITTFTQYTLERGIPNIGSARTVGYYENKQDALNAVLENWCDIFESTYTYAVVEYIEPGLYNPATERWFFKWCDTHNAYEPINAFEDCWGNYAFG